jgi:hypothetical protein
MSTHVSFVQNLRNEKNNDMYIIINSNHSTRHRDSSTRHKSNGSDSLEI